MRRIMLNYWFYLPFVLLTLAGRNVSAQDSSFKVSIVSPTAASLGKYGDMPVGYHTGTPNVNIPLYTVKSGKLSLPVSMSYHASGLKVQEQASWVGAGWSLNAGGVITRTVVGEPDDRGYMNTHVTNGHYRDYGYNSYLFIPSTGSPPPPTFDNMKPDDYNFITAYKDGEPDLFFFNFGGYSGKFYFNDDRTPIFVPEEDFKIQVDLYSGGGLGPGFNGFIITTPDGNQYYFGSTGNTGAVAPYEVSIPSTTQSGLSYATSAISAWYLNKIVSADGMDSIKLTYSQENYSDYTVSMFPMQTGGFPSTSILTTPATYNFNLVKNFIQGVRLSQVSFANGTLNFTPSASPRTDLAAAFSNNSGMYDAANTYSSTNLYPAYALGSISLSDNNGFCKKDSFYYSYFYDNSPLNTPLLNMANAANIHSDAYRLRLDSLQETSCDNTAKVPPYKFSYFSELVPRKLSFGLDHWGFSNGATSNSVLTPSFTISKGMQIEMVQGANREAAWPAMRGGALQQITYPTGGTTRLVFQSHDTYGISTTVTPALVGGESQSSYSTSNPNPKDTFRTSSSCANDIFSVDVTSSAQEGTITGNLMLYDSLGNTLNNFGTGPNGEERLYYIHLLPGTKYITQMYASFGATGQGEAGGEIYDWVPSTYQGNLAVGGLRIDSLITSDGISATNNTVTTYDYGGSHSKGILYSRPVYAQSVRNDIYGLVYGPSGATGCPTGDGGASAFLLSPGSILPMATTQGSHIGYNQVVVSQTGNGSSIYQYYGSNYWDNVISDVCTRTIDLTTCSSTIPSYPYAPLPFEYMRGELEYEAHLNQGGQYLKDAWYFPSYLPDSIVTPGYIASGGFYTVSTPYLLQSAYKVQDSVVATDYDNVSQSFLTTINTTNYGSHFHHQPTRKTCTTSTGDLLTTNILYAADFRIAACDNLPDSLLYYQTAVHNDSVNFYSTLSSCTPQGGFYSSCRLPTYENFMRYISLARIAYINRSLAYSSLFNTNHLTAKNSADTLLKPILRLQDEFNNVPIEVSEWKNLNLKHASFTKYDTSVSPVGVAYPDRTQLINLQATSTSFTPAAVSGSSITRDSRYLDETTYKFSNGNPQQLISHDGVPNAYIWDYQNKEPIAKVSNATVDQVAYTSFEADGSGSWAIASPSRIAGGITGTQCYGLTNGTCTRSGLNSGNTYVVSFWATAGSFAISGSTGNTQGKTIVINGATWTYYEYTVSGTSTITVSGTSNIDELRLYPSNAQMTTYTYSPLTGMTAQCDADNRITYYTYDKLSRLAYIRDQDGNIIKTYQYHYQGQP